MRDIPVGLNCCPHTAPVRAVCCPPVQRKVAAEKEKTEGAAASKGSGGGMQRTPSFTGKPAGDAGASAGGRQRYADAGDGKADDRGREDFKDADDE